MSLDPLYVFLGEVFIQVLCPLNAEKAFDKVQHPFLIKRLSKVGIRGAFLNIIKAI